jgi:hypothetical protein
MRKQAVKQEFENPSMELARNALAKSIARWTALDGPLVTAIPALSTTLLHADRIGPWRGRISTFLLDIQRFHLVYLTHSRASFYRI